MDRSVKALVLGSAVALLGIIASALPPMIQAEFDWGGDLLFRMRGPRPVPNDVIVVSIDHKSARQLGLPEDPQKWPRSIHARMVRQLKNAGALAIAFDVRFEEPQALNHDDVFAEAIRQAGNVVLLQYIEKQTHPLPLANALTLVKVKPLVKQLLDTKAGIAPYILPKLPVKLIHHWVFYPEAGDAATLPVLAYQIFAKGFGREKLLELIKTETQVRTQRFDPSIKDETQLFRQLRQLFQEDPTLSERLKHRLKKKPWSTTQARILRTLIDIYSGSNNRVFDFYGPPETIATVPYHRALGQTHSGSNQPISPVDFEGKAVFIGFTEQLQEKWDYFHTVYTQADGSTLSGVETAATAFANLLENRHGRPLSTQHHVILVALWGMTLGLLFMFLPVRVFIPIIALLTLVYLFSAHWLFSQDGTWLPLVTPLGLQLPLALLATLFWRYHNLRKQREAIRTTLAHHVPDWVVDELIRTHRRLLTTGNQCHGSSLMTDASQFTKMAETLKPIQLHALLNQYYQHLFEPVTGHGGFISDVKGDSMLALWTEDKAQRSCREQACKAALNIIVRIEQLTLVEINDRLPTRIGLHYGEMHLGHVGASNHYEFRAVGDVVNSSERLEQLNKTLGTRILASEEAIDGVGGVTTRYVGDFRLPGKSQSLRVHELVCLDEETNHKTQRLHHAFAAALNSIYRQQWQQALTAFEKILAQDGHDGPSLYYRDLCLQYVNSPPGPDWDRVIEITKK